MTTDLITEETLAVENFPEIEINAFGALGVSEKILPALTELGYETPSPVQAKSIPALMQGRDILSQAQTGTGKTAAFALPALSRIEIQEKDPQVLVLAPTRELAIQVAESFQSYAKHMNGFHVLPIYGGADFRPQLKALKRGVHVVVGTPGRVMDHMRRGTLILDNIKTLVLDEADEMLNMGFIEDIEWVLEQIPQEKQIALFSATMPKAIKKIAETYLHDPAQIHIAPKDKTVTSIEQCYTIVSKNNKLEALTRFLEIEDINAVLIFTRTKTSSAELADKLQARGYNAAALNGDLKQSLREKIIGHLKRGTLDIIVATEVAARGLDVERISHVVNYDIPHDVESYVHRIGRTGRAGRQGKALLFVAPRERRMLKDIERVIGKSLTAVEPPKAHEITAKRTEKFTQTVLDAVTNEGIDDARSVVERIVHENEISELDVAAALTCLLRAKDIKNNLSNDNVFEKDSFDNDDRSSRNRPPRGAKRGGFEEGMTRCTIEVGRNHRIQPGEIVGLIANKCDVNRSVIGAIKIMDNQTQVDIADNVVKNIVKNLDGCRLRNLPLSIKIASQGVKRSRSEGGERRSSRRGDGPRSESRSRRDGGSRGGSKFASKGKAKSERKPRKGSAASKKGRSNSKRG